MSQLMSFLENYVLPYWPWIVAVIIGIVLIYAIKRMAHRVMGILMIGFFLGGGTITGVSTWLSDRGLSLPNFRLW